MNRSHLTLLRTWTAALLGLAAVAPGGALAGECPRLDGVWREAGAVVECV